MSASIHLRAAALAIFGLLLWAGTADAQGRDASLPFTGTELAFEGGSVPYAGRPFSFRGRAYRVRGLAELIAYGGARVRARWVHEASEQGGPERSFVADERGDFQGAIDLPENPSEASGIEILLERGGQERRFHFPLSPLPSSTLTARFDREIYEPGESAHLWIRAEDRLTGRPLGDLPVRVVIDGAVRREAEIRTRASGVASLTVELPEGSSGLLEVAVTGDHQRLTASAHIGGREQARLFLEVELSPETASPHQPVQVSARVLSPSGGPVAGAQVTFRLDGEIHAEARSDEEGWARVRMVAPSYLQHETGAVPLVVEASHSAFGVARRYRSLRLAVPLVLHVEASPERGTLLPEIDDRVYIEVLDGAGDPPPVGTEVEIRGPGLPGGRRSLRTDARGFVVLPIRLPPEAATTLSEGPTAHLRVEIAGPLPRTLTLPLRVDREALVAPRAVQPVVSPGDPVEVALLRRPAARGLPVVVELLRRGPGQRRTLLSHTVATGGQQRVRLQAPTDRLGLFEIRARPLLFGEVGEGHGSSAGLLVRPRVPSFPEVRTDRERYEVGEQVRVSLHTPPGAPRSWAAVLVRDLAAHAGERPFTSRFLSQDFEKALLDPSQPALEPLLRATLAAYLEADRVPDQAPPLTDPFGLSSDMAFNGEGRQTRDPFPLAAEMRRRGLIPAMREAERLLGEALENEALDEVTELRGGRRRFREDLLASLEEPPTTLGGGALTISMLEAADPAFRYDAVARRVARRQLVRLYVALARFLDPGEGASLAQLSAAREPSERWLARMQREGLIEAHELRDPWGGRFVLRRASRPAFVVAPAAASLELVSPGPDGRLGSADDYRDPFARAVPQGSAYAVASEEDALMRQLASTNPTEEVLAAMLEAFERHTAEMLEDAIGDAVGGGIGEGTIGLGNLGTIGHGGGGGSGFGYGRGSGSASGAIGRGIHVVQGLPTLARLLRERFPGTLHFSPDMELSADGQSELRVPLMDAITTYLVEVIVFREDGFSWSAHTRFRVDREVVVEAPLPERVEVGERFLLPVRVTNRGEEPRELSLIAEGAEALGIEAISREGLVVPARGSLELPLPIEASRAGEARMSFTLRGRDGAPLDALRRPLRARLPARPMHRRIEALAGAGPPLRFELPAYALPRAGSTVELIAGPELFGVIGDASLSGWAQAFGGGPSPAPTTRWGPEGERFAMQLASSWGQPRVSDRQLSEQLLPRLTEELSRLERAQERARRLREAGTRTRRGARSEGGVTEEQRREAKILLALAPAVRSLDRRPAEAREALTETVRALRERVRAWASEATEGADSLSLAAAALAWTAPVGERDARAAELMRRALRSEVRADQEVWIVAPRRSEEATALAALAQIALGERAYAYTLLSTLGRWATTGRPPSEEARAYASAALLSLTRGRRPSAARVEIDGHAERLLLREGQARMEAPALGAPGSHTVSVELEYEGEGPRSGPGSPALLRVRSEHGLPWDRGPEIAGPLALELAMAPSAHRGEGLRGVLTVHNRGPRVIGSAALELTLPAGARPGRVEGYGLREQRFDGSGLSLRLRALMPGATRRFEIPLRFELEGSFQSFGITAHPEDRPEAESLLLPRALRIEAMIDATEEP